jgi:hypothetical protein
VFLSLRTGLPGGETTVAELSAAYQERAESPCKTGSSALHGNVIQRSVRRQTYSHLTAERDFS